VLTRDARLESGEHQIDGYDVEGFPVRLCTKVGPPSVRDVVHQFRIELSREAVLSRAKQRLYLFNDANEPEGDEP